MSKRSLAKGHDEMLMDLVAEFRDKVGGGFIMEDVTDWIPREGLLPLPKVDPKKLLTRKLKQAARRRKRIDVQGRTVRELIAAKIDRVDENGNLMIDVVWDYLNVMTVDHALSAFSQRDEIIEKQRLSATREVQSFLDNNPNAKGHEAQFRFPFMLEAPSEQVTERISESEIVVQKDPELEPKDPELEPKKSKRKPR